MLRRNSMPCTHNTALEQRECGFHSISRADQPLFIAHIFIGAVIHALMSRLSELGRCEIIEFRFIRHDDIYRLVYIASDDLIQGSLVDLVRVDEVQATIALTNTDYGSLIFKLSFVAALFSANVGLINLYRAGKFVLYFGHRSPD